MRLIHILEATQAKLIAPKGHVLLYRGDSTKIDKFDVGKTSLFGLFGHGIYLTDNKRVAGDYVSKADKGDVIFTLSGARTKKDVLDYWLRRQAAKFDADGNDRSKEVAYWTKDVPYSDGTDWAMVLPRLEGERQARFNAAKAKWLRMSKEYEVRIKLDGTGVIQRKPGKGQGVITAFFIPESYLRSTLVADEPIDSRVLQTITWALQKHGDGATARDIQNHIRMREREGEDTSFRDVFTGITADSPLKHDMAAQVEFRDALESQGYVGINYLGGVSMGGGYKHRAYVLWDDRKVNKWRAD